MEQVFHYLKSNWLGNRLFATVEDVHAALADAWTRLLAEPDCIRSITTREWASLIT